MSWFLLYSFSITGMTKYRKLSGLKLCIPSILQLYRLEIWHRPHWSEIRRQQGYIPSGGSGGESMALPAFLGPWHPISIFKTRDVAALWPLYRSHLPLILNSPGKQRPVLRIHVFASGPPGQSRKLSPLSPAINFIMSAKFLFRCEAPYSQVLEIRVWTSSGDHYSANHTVCPSVASLFLNPRGCSVVFCRARWRPSSFICFLSTLVA